MNDIDNLWKRTEALNSLIGECRMRIDRLETHLAKLESSDARHIVVAPNAPANGPESPSVVDVEKLLLDMNSNPTTATLTESAPPDPKSLLEQKSRSRIMESLRSEIEAALLRGVAWIYIRDVLRSLTISPSSTVSEPSNAGSSK